MIYIFLCGGQYNRIRLNVFQIKTTVIGAQFEFSNLRKPCCPSVNDKALDFINDYSSMYLCISIDMEMSLVRPSTDTSLKISLIKLRDYIITEDAISAYNQTFISVRLCKLSDCLLKH